MRQAGAIPAGATTRDRLGEWIDRHSGTFFIAPAVTLILIFAIFPTIYSIFFALSRVRFTGDGLKFRYVGFRNFAKQFFGSSEVHFLGRTDPVSIFGMVIFAVVVVAVLWWLIRSRKITTWVGMIGRTISAAMAIFLAWILCTSLLSGNSIGTLYTTLFYVIVGCGLQFVIGTGLAFLCSQPISGEELFPGDLFHSADDHAAGRRVRDEDGGQTSPRVRSSRSSATRGSRTGSGPRMPGRPGS